jgi:hypothetical protein
MTARSSGSARTSFPRLPKKDFEKLAEVTINESRKYSRRELARTSGYSLREVSRLLSGKVAATSQAIARLQAAINALEKEKKETPEILSRAKQTIQKGKISLRKFSTQAGIDPQIYPTSSLGKDASALKCSQNSNGY